MISEMESMLSEIEDDTNPASVAKSRILTALLRRKTDRLEKLQRKLRWIEFASHRSKQ